MSTKERKHPAPPRYDEACKAGAVPVSYTHLRMPKDPTIEAQLKKNIQNKENLLRELDAKLQSCLLYTSRCV